MAILRAKSLQQNLDLDQDVIDCIAQNISGNIRELEGILNIIAIQTSTGKVRVNISDHKRNNQSTIQNLKKIFRQKTWCVSFRIFTTSIRIRFTENRKKEVVKPRQIIMYLLREDMGVSYPSIGEKLGGRDHTTVIHSCEKMKNDIKNNQSLLQEINQLRASIV